MQLVRKKAATTWAAMKQVKPINVLLGLVAVFVVFSLGASYGRGDIRLGRDAIFNKQVSGKLPNDLDYAAVEDVYDKLRTGYDGTLDQQKLMDGLKHGLAQASGDPYTEYFNAEEAKDFSSQLDGTFVGIGAELGKDADGNVIVIAPISGFPAERAGLKPNDIIATVNGESASGQSVDQVVKKIRGEAGTKVKLQLVRNKSEQIEVEITREQIKVPSVKSEILDGNIGYLRITRFGDDTTRLATEAANNFAQAKVKGVVLDLRDDPGGLLDAAVDVSSLWLKPGQTVLQEKRGGVLIRTYRANGTNPLQGVPTVTLISAGSASASEITAGALRDNKASTLMGVKSFGKGSVQNVNQLEDGSILKVTIAHWFTPSGKGIDKQGIEPDKKVERSDDDVKNNRDPQKDAAVELLKTQ